jgi:uncharacterized protein YhbP (UPF0306 family)
VADERTLVEITRAIVDTSLYMVLATADESGRPWASPVYFAPAAYREFFWVSRPEARHSRNLEARPQVSLAIFDSTVPIGTGRGVYVSAVAEQLDGDARLPGLDVFSRRSRAHGGAPLALADIEAPAPLRLYRATAAEVYALDEHDQRVLVQP